MRVSLKLSSSKTISFVYHYVTTKRKHVNTIRYKLVLVEIWPLSKYMFFSYSVRLSFPIKYYVSSITFIISHSLQSSHRRFVKYKRHESLLGCTRKHFPAAKYVLLSLFAPELRGNPLQFSSFRCNLKNLV